ncbi:MAG TPA: hypothetical protein VKK79_20185 [Candidatus Lokiarchaeia archaeon]|nr:hypothetical protein [Candidatus Lokiarchaeia archaeon]
MVLKVSILPISTARRLSRLMPVLTERVARSETGMALESVEGGFLMIFQDSATFQQHMATLQETIASIANNQGFLESPPPEIGGVEIPIEFPKKGVNFVLEPSSSGLKKKETCASLVELFTPLEDVISARLLPEGDRVEFSCPTFLSYSLFTHLFTDRHVA